MKNMKTFLCCIVFLAGLAGAPPPAEIKGYLLDKSCADEDGKKPGFAEKHQKSCLLMKPCAQSGYGVMTESLKYIKFDKNGDAMAAKLIAGLKKNDDIKVNVTGEIQGEGDTIKVTKLTLQ